MWSSASVPRSQSELCINHFVPLVHSSHIVDASCLSDGDFDFYDIESRDCSETEIEPNTNIFEDCIIPESEHQYDHLLDSSESEPSCSRQYASESEFEPIFSQNAVENPKAPESDYETNENEPEIKPNPCPNMSEPTLSEVDETSGPLKSGFMNIDMAFQLLTRGIQGRDSIPSGRKDNVFYIIDNSFNKESRKHGKRSNFPDDCGAWDASKGSSPTSHYISSGNILKQTYCRDGLYCFKKQIKGKVGYCPLEPQPVKDDIIHIHRYYTVLKKDPNYKKKVTWLGDGGARSNCAIVEYDGNFPGLCPHGNSTDIDAEYTRIPPHVMDEINELTGKMKPHKIMNKLTAKYDVLTGPTELRQIYDKQYRERQKEKTVDGHKDNFADQIRTLENKVTEKDSFVRSIFKDSGRTPTIILFTDEQILDLKNMCCSGKTVLSVDKTFMLCKMHCYTVTCFKQLSVNRVRTGQNPVFLGPLFIHDNSDFETFSHFFFQLRLKFRDAPLSKLVIGSDDEKALVKAITTVNTCSLHPTLRRKCTTHTD
jgi:hypothetical protein